MYRFHLAEIEDQGWCPRRIRQAITDMLRVIHGWFGTADLLTDQLEIIARNLPETGPITILDFCSGAGGPLVEVRQRLQQRLGREVQLWMSDLYPHEDACQRFGDEPGAPLRYLSQPVDATLPFSAAPSGPVIRTLICSFHHLRPEAARQVLRAAEEAGDPLLIFEISDNRTPPRWLWWLALGPNFLFGLWVALFLQPRTPARLLLSFLVPIIPACFAWDGAVSNVRTYGSRDLDELVAGAGQGTHVWSGETVAGRWLPHWVVVGQPRGPSTHAGDTAIS